MKYTGEAWRVGTTTTGNCDQIKNTRKKAKPKNTGHKSLCRFFRRFIARLYLIIPFYQSAWLRLNYLLQLHELFLSLQMDFLMPFWDCSLTFYLVSREEKSVYWCNLNVIVVLKGNLLIKNVLLCFLDTYCLFNGGDCQALTSSGKHKSN